MDRQGLTLQDVDREYRDAIYRLETFRLRRNRVTGSTSAAISELSHDLSRHLQDNFFRHTEDLSSLGHAAVAIAEHAKQIISNIDPIKDARTLSTHILEPILEPPVFYNNYFVGECRSLLFGISLVDYVSDNPSGSQVPLIVRRCIEELDHHLDFQGLFRVSPNLGVVQQIIHAIEKDETIFSFEDYRDDPATIGGILKVSLLFLQKSEFGLNRFIDSYTFVNYLLQYSPSQFTIVLPIL